MPAALYNVNGPVDLIQNSISISSSGDNTLVDAPGAGLRLVICDFELINETTTPSVVLIKFGADIKRRYLFQNQGNGIAMAFSTHREWRLPANTAFIANLSGALAHGGGLSYFLERA